MLPYGYGPVETGQPYTATTHTEDSIPLKGTTAPPPPPRFPSSPPWRDVFFFFLFYVHAGVVVYIAVRNAGNKAKPEKDDHDEEQTSAENIGQDELAVITLGSMVLAAAIAAAWILVLRQYARSLIYATIGTILTLELLACLVFFTTGVLGMGIMMLILFIISLVFYILVRDRIPFASAMLQLAARLVRKYPATIGTSYAMLIPQLLWFAVCGFALFAILRQAEEDVTDRQRLEVAFVVFSVLWSSQVIRNIVHVATAGAFAAWYFFHNTSSLPPNPTWRAFKLALSRSFGSICLGSLLVAIVQFIRQMLNQARRRDNLLAVCADCLLGCLESMIRYFNKYAFTYIALYGKSFFGAGKDAWGLLMDRGLDMVINDDIIGGVLFLGSLVGGIIVGAIAGICGAISLDHKGDWWIAALIGFFLGIFFLLVAMQVVESGVATMFVCFAEDPQRLQTASPDDFQDIQMAWHGRFGKSLW